MADENVVVEEVTIPDTVYFVSWYLHNGTNDGWAYKVENKYADKSSAEKAFYTLLGNYIGGDTYDIVTALLNDSKGNIWINKYWTSLEEDKDEPIVYPTTEIA